MSECDGIKDIQVIPLRRSKENIFFFSPHMYTKKKNIQKQIEMKKAYHLRKKRFFYDYYPERALALGNTTETDIK